MQSFRREDPLTMGTRSIRCIVPVVLTAIMAASLAGAATAQAANQVKIVGILLSVKHRVGPTGTFAASKVGTLLPPGSRIQTGARSKCALQFPNGAVIRMDERSDLVIQSPGDTSTQLNSGRIWAKVIAGTTARVQGSSGVAVVKGTEWTFSGDAITCYDGAVSYEVGANATDVPKGYEGYIGANGDVHVRTAPGRAYPGGDLIQWFGGVSEGVATRSLPSSSADEERKRRQISLDATIRAATTPTTGRINVTVMGADASAAAPGGSFPGVDPNTLAPLRLSRPTASWVGIDMGSMGLHQGEPLPDRQYFFGPYTPADAFGYVGPGGSTYGLRVRPHVVYHSLYVEVGATTRTSSWYGDGTDITEAFAQYRDDRGSATVGRQRFLRGPVNNNRLGSLLTFETGDAVRVQADVGKLDIDLAYVDKMGPVIGPVSQGWYGRVQCPVSGGIIAANLVTLRGESGPGLSIDIAAPVIGGALDIYGEWGQDAADNDLYTVGAYFPGLYQREELDLFVEYADRDGLPSLASTRVYKHFDEDLTGVLTIDKQSGESVNFGAGVIWRFGD